MEKIEGDDRRVWIQSQLVPFVQYDSPGWNGNRVENCVPPHFESYAKILHAIYEDQSVSDREETWDEWSKSDPSTREPLPRSAFEALTPEQLAAIGVRRVRWRDLAAQYGLSFHAEVNDQSFSNRMRNGSWPRYLFGPAEGALDDSCMRRLVALLKARTGEQSCDFTYFITTFVDLDRPFSLKAPLSEFDLVASEGAAFTPEYWWPQDFSWCVCSDWDLTFTLVGGSRELVNDLLADDLLEAVEARPGHRVDRRADAVNNRSP